jgi:hypothetical protein
MFVSATTEEREHWAMTDTLADGSFRLAGLGERTYNPFAGTALAGFGVRHGVRPGDEEVVLSLRPGGRVRVSVSGPGRAPLASAYVQVPRAGGAAVGSESGSLTDAQGVAEIPHLRARSRSRRSSARRRSGRRAASR